jgi:hypothetical protein
MKRTSINVTIALFLGLGLTLVSLWLLSAGPRLAYAQGPDGYSTYYVAPFCTGVPLPCYNTLQAAVDAADDPEDVIKVAAGTYTDVSVRPRNDVTTTGVVTQVVYISKTVVIRGGYTTAFTGPSNPEANPTTLDAQGQGRVLYITGGPSAGSGQVISPTLEGLRITGGDAGELGGDTLGGNAGGGVYVITATAIISGNWVFSNTAEHTGGAIYLYNSPAMINNNTVTSNTVVGLGGGLGLWYSSATIYHNTISANTASWGGALSLLHSDATVSANIVVSNTALADGGGIALGYSSATLSDNMVLSNISSSYGGGLYLYFSDATLTDNAVISNSADLGGGVLLDVSHAMLNGNTVIANSADEGGGLLLARSHATLTNNVVADNRADTLGSGIYLVVASSSHLSHNTIAHNTGGDGSGINVIDDSTVVLTDTILVGQTVGITVAAGSTVTLEATLWGSGTWANGADWGGAGTIVTGTHNYWGDPAFVNPDAGDYHIGPGSAAIDSGVDAGVTVDIDGDSRPIGAGYDLGADEFSAASSTEHFIYLPVVLRQPS